MKYKVIGWIDADIENYPYHKGITPPVRAAIVKDIREHGYLFGGDAHETRLPLLNDGTCVSYSWRGWGGVMAEAHGEKGELSYMFAYMDMLIDPKKIKYPSTGDIDESQIVPKASITEVFVMHLSGDMFEAVKAGTKTVEVRLFDEKRKRIDIGDYIEFRREGNEEDRILKRVGDIYAEPSFREIFERNTFNARSEWVRRFSPEQFGFPENCSVEDFVDGMHKYYDKEKEEELGAIAFVLEQPHACRTEFSVCLDSPECFQMFNSKLADPDISSEEMDRVLHEAMDIGLVHDALEELSDQFMHRSWENYRIGLNSNYNVDVNVMLKETLKELLGKEDRLKAIHDRYCACLTLHIEATISKDSDEPKQILSLDRDIIEFLHRTGTKLDFRYFVV